MGTQNWKESIRQTGSVFCYPISTNPINVEEIWSNQQSTVYLHIPFCRQVCTFCCYNQSKSVFSEKQEKSYVAAVKKEIRLLKEKGVLQKGSYECLYVGGGTPTTLNGEELFAIGDEIRRELSLPQAAQISVETNPATTSEETVKHLVKAGVNRISVGLQSDMDKYLKMFNCTHTFRDFERTNEILRKNQIRTINVDLLYRLPEQTLDEWKKTLQRVIEFEPEHISIYSLGVFKQTRLYQDLESLKYQDVPDFQTEMRLREIAKDVLFANGYNMNTLDEFSKDGYDNSYAAISRLGQTLAIGAGAFGVMNDIFYQNVVAPEEYMDYLSKDQLPGINGVKLVGKEKISRYMALMPYYLGFNVNEFENLFGFSPELLYGDILNDLVENSYMYKDGDDYKLTLKGEVFSPKVSQLFYSQAQKKMVERYLQFCG